MAKRRKKKKITSVCGMCEYFYKSEVTAKGIRKCLKKNDLVRHITESCTDIKYADYIWCLVYEYWIQPCMCIGRAERRHEKCHKCNKYKIYLERRKNLELKNKIDKVKKIKNKKQKGEKNYEQRSICMGCR